MNQIKPSPKIAVVGSGNVASHLFKALSKAGADVCIVNSRTLEGLPSSTDVALIAVKDMAIAEVAARLKGKAGTIAHTSGSTPMEVLKDSAPAYGVFYPMQTFTKGVELDYSDIPFFIEGSDTATADTLSRIAASISDSVVAADSERRRLLHLASVFACNFSNHLVAIADEILKGDGMDYRMLLPLLRQTVKKLETLSPAEAQTGPAARLDFKIMNRHIEMLQDRPVLREIYEDLSADIIRSRGENGAES